VTLCGVVIGYRRFGEPCCLYRHHQDKVSRQPADDDTFLYGIGDAKHYLGTGLFLHKKMISAVKRVECFSDRCHIYH